jgi:gephyrin
MASGPLKAALLIVSTTAAQDPSTDASGPILSQVLKEEGEGKWEVHETAIVTDDIRAIQSRIMAWTDGPDAVNLVITTGGTGFATGDGTPEVRLYRFEETWHAHSLDRQLHPCCTNKLQV